MDRDETVHSVARALTVVETLNQRQVTSLELLHRTTGVPKPTLVRLLETLIAAGYVYRVSRREGYAVTQNVLRLSAGLRLRDVLVDVARPLMDAFTLEHKWQISLGTQEGGRLLIRATTRHLSPFSREELFLNRPVNMLASVIGRAYFAHCSDAEREFILKMARTADLAEADTSSPEQQRAIVEMTRRQRYAGDRRDRPGPYRAIAIPVMAAPPGGEILGALVIFYYVSVMSERQAAERYLAPLYALAGEIARGVAASPIGGTAPEISPARVAQPA
jgi:IclR family mhp operon transcriptional activator